MHEIGAPLGWIILRMLLHEIGCDKLMPWEAHDIIIQKPQDIWWCIIYYIHHVNVFSICWLIYWSVSSPLPNSGPSFTNLNIDLFLFLNFQKHICMYSLWYLKNLSFDDPTFQKCAFSNAWLHYLNCWTCLLIFLNLSSQMSVSLCSLNSCTFCFFWDL